MRLLIINGSPKLGKNNTAILLENFVEGFKETKGNEVDILRMNNEQACKKAISRFESAEMVLIGFPLYSYAMPAGVKSFIEGLEPLLGRCQGKKVGFLVQYGFIEAIHARPLELYLEHISKSLCCEYLGTIIKGGCDGLSKNKNRYKKFRKGIYEIGKSFGETGKFNKVQIDAYAAPETQKKHNSFLVSIALKIINKVFWEKSLKNNGLNCESSFAKPYGK